ncbi:hypothetical protein BaOVIS_023490 [Babesia ovis]|uniref:6-Cys domain-containing protein n=1 Tax=Babesia ovis TaxID=5869 RepID=A0A9W5WVD8_BABOV|nr:hypothetical protein BaOVIS_023490 [Babesia ovis]
MVASIHFNSLLLASFVAIFTAHSVYGDHLATVQVNLSNYRSDHKPFSTTEFVFSHPHKLSIICDSAGYDDGEHTLYPTDPKNKSLLPLLGADFEGAIENEVPSHFLYRSSDLYIESTKHNDFTVNIMVTKTKETIIMAKNPESFSLNFVCKYQPKAKHKSPTYKWLKVKFMDVYPMAFGCETGTNMLFKNSLPTILPVNPNSMLPTCTVEIEPKMLFGIYCEKGQIISPPNCFTEEELAALDGVIIPYVPDWAEVTPEAKNKKLSTRFKLFKVSANPIMKNIITKCFCKSKTGKKRVIKIKHMVAKNVDLHHLLKDTDLSASNRIIRGERLEPGVKMGFNIPLDNKYHLGRYGIMSGSIFPSNLLYNTLQNTKDTALTLTSLKHLIGYKGIDITYKAVRNKMKYTFNYKKDAVLVVKTTTPSINYKLTLKPEETPKPEDYIFTLMYYIYPTDPYTYGCGVDSVDLFRPTGFKLQHEPGAVSTTKCKVNPYLSSPVGFYCPKGFTLEPPNCFTEMINKYTNDVVALSTVAPFARVVDTNNIKTVDFHVPRHVKHDIVYEGYSLMCNCIDEKGSVRASITLDLRDPLDSAVVDEYADDLS